MGSWTFIRDRLAAVLEEIGLQQRQAEYVGRAEAASPATGLMKKHNAEQAKLVDLALTLPKPEPRHRAVSTTVPPKNPAAQAKPKPAAKPATKTMRRKRASQTDPAGTKR